MSQGPDEEAPPARPGINGLSARLWIAGLLLAVVVGVTYVPAAGLDFIYDDQVLLLGTPAPQAVAAQLERYRERADPGASTPTSQPTPALP